MKNSKWVVVILILFLLFGMGIRTSSIGRAVTIPEIKEDSSSVDTIPFETAYISGDTPQKEGYSFVGWTLDANLDYSQIAKQYQGIALEQWNFKNLLMEDKNTKEVLAADIYNVASKLGLINPNGEAEYVTMIPVFIKNPTITFDPIIQSKDYFFYEDEQGITQDILKWGIKVTDTYDGDSLDVSIDDITYHVGTSKKKTVVSPDELETAKEYIGICQMNISVQNSRGGTANKSIRFEIKENKEPSLEFLDGIKEASYFLEEVKDISCLKGEEMTNNSLRDLIYESIYLKDDVEEEGELLHNFKYTLEEDFKPIESGEKEKEYQIHLLVKDQYGHRFYMKDGDKKQYGLGKESKDKMKLVVLDTGAYKRANQGYVRFISKDYLWTLLPNSKWKSGKCKEVLERAVNKNPDMTADCEQIWKFSAEDIKAIKEETEKQNNPYTLNSYEAFIDKFSHCRIK